MNCIGCGESVRQRPRRWIEVCQLLELNLGDHGEVRTEVSFVACSWDCVQVGARATGIDSGGAS